VAEQRYHAVLEVLDAVPIVEVAERYGVSRQSVHAWVRRYQAGGLEGLADRSHRPASCPHQLPVGIAARVCELRRQHPGWGPQRPRHELGRRGLEPLPSASSIYRALVRAGLIEPGRGRRRVWTRWERGQAMQLWQLDIMGGIWLADGRELKLVTGIDDHSRFCVLAALVTQATARAVCGAFAAALQTHGVPEEVLTDNGRQFTGRFAKPRPAEVLFERICRENGIAARLTQPRSPTTTGKIERFHKTLRAELLVGLPAFPDQATAQLVLDAWVDDYNIRRPHQALAMHPPADRFRATSQPAASVPAPLPPRLPADLGGQLGAQLASGRDGPGSGDGLPGPVELRVLVPASGNLKLAGRQLWLGPRLAGRTLTVRADLRSLHLLVDGQLLKTLPSRYRPEQLARLAALPGAQPTGPAPGPAAGRLEPGAAVQVIRGVNRAGHLILGGRSLAVGVAYAGQRAVVHVTDQLVHMVVDGRLVKTLASPFTAEQAGRLRGASVAEPLPPVPHGPVVVQRQVAERGQVQVAGQRLQVGMSHARKLVTIQVSDSAFRITDADGALLKTIARTTSGEVTRHKAYTTKHTR
jgi:transposase InsO family protein